MLQEVLFPCQKPRNMVNYSVLAFDTQWKTSENNQKCPNWSFSFKLQKTGGGSSFLELSPARLRPHLPKRAQIRASPPHTPQISFASLIPILSPGLRLAFLIFIYHNSYIDRPGSSMWILFPLLLENTEFWSLCRNTIVPHKKCRCHKRCFLVVGCSCRSERHCRRLVGHCCRCHLVLSGKSPKLPKKGRSCWKPVYWPKGKN